jgi:tRNA modification GTPase
LINNANAGLILVNKSDIFSPVDDGEHQKILKISAMNGTGIDELKNRLLQLANVNSNQNEIVVTNLRHYEALNNALLALHRVAESIDNNISGDFLVIDLRKALYHLGEITGQITPDDILGSVFSRFCIGK